MKTFRLEQQQLSQRKKEMLAYYKRCHQQGTCSETLIREIEQQFPGECLNYLIWEELRHFFLDAYEEIRRFIRWPF